MKFLIVGANFTNKGAQSMLFVTVDKIKKAFPEASIFFGTRTYIENDNYRFNTLYFSKATKMVALGEFKISWFLIRLLKDFIKFIFRKDDILLYYLHTKKIITSIDFIIDVSGFNIGKKWGKEIHEFYFDNIKLSRKFNIPIYLMPQSFGSFNYDNENRFYKDRMLELFPYAAKIFAREIEGKNSLEKEFGLTNVELSTDLVLQNPDINLHNIFIDVPEIKLPTIKTIHNIGIIPNKQCFNHGIAEKNLILYQKIIDLLLTLGKEVYLFRHSQEDLEICINIKKLYGNEKRVHLIENNFSCFEYDAFVRNFEYIVCSRYHGIVHAYKNSIPSIALGWAIKYEELAKNVSQEEFAFDITNEFFTSAKALKAINRMNLEHRKNRDIIKNRVSEIQKNNCFAFLESLRSEDE